MSAGDKICQAFAQRPDIVQSIARTTVKAPDSERLFEDIAHYIIDLRDTLTRASSQINEGPSSKKRKLEHRPIGGLTWGKGADYTFEDVSFSIPQRKKLKLEIGLPSHQGVRAVNSSGIVELGVSWACIQDVVCLPVPEKAQAQFNFCIFPIATEENPPDQILWTVADNVPKEGIVSGISMQAGDTLKTILVTTINKALKPLKKSVIEPEKREFASQVVQAHRKGEVAFHIKAFRGSKDGFLYLLSSAIVWGFKKPLEYFTFDMIDTISYTSVLQRTFNISIAVRSSQNADVRELEFSMVDQADFAGIDEYIKRHGLQDASMAEQRRAKKLNINGVKGTEKAGEGEEEEEGELEKARREAEDLEDEEEEDENFDPGSAGESEGSGSSSEEEGDEAEGAEPDLVAEELGSEAESVGS